MILKWDLQLIKCDHAHHIDLARDVLHWRGNVDQVIEPIANHKSFGWKFLASLSACYFLKNYWAYLCCLGKQLSFERRGTVICVTTTLRSGHPSKRCSIPITSKLPDQFGNPLVILFDGQPLLFRRRYSDRGVKLTTFI
jgi:hypothetical protein